MTWRPYAAGVVISAGVFVTGIMWHNHQSPHIAAEDVAALTADVRARAIVFYATSNASPTAAFIQGLNSHRGLRPESNTVSTVRSRKLLEQLTYDLKRLIVPAAPGRAIGPDATPYDSPINWLPDDSCFTPGASLVDYPTVSFAVASSNADATGYVTREWSASSARATTIPHIITVNTRTVPYQNCYDFSDTTGLYVPGVTEFLGGYPPIEGVISNCWWNNMGLGDDLYIWPRFEHVTPTGTVAYTHHQLSTNTLADARTVLTNMTRLCLISSKRNEQFWQCDTNSYTTQGDSGAGNFWDFAIWAREANNQFVRTNAPPPEGFFTAPWTLVQNNILTALNTATYRVPFSGSFGFPYTLYEFGWFAKAEYSYYYREYGDPPVPNSGNGWYCFSSARSVPSIDHAPSRSFLSQVYCAWPYQWMYDSNLVARVRYYAVFGTSSGVPNFLLDHRGHTYNTGGYADMVHDPESYEWSWNCTPLTSALLYPDTDPVCDYPISYGNKLPVPLYCNSSMIDKIGSGSYASTTPETWSAVLLADAASPASAPRVDIGPVGSIDIGSTPMLFASGEQRWTESGDNGYYVYEEAMAEGRLTHRSLALYALICVVDFNFNNYSTGGKSEEYTPPWATNAPALTP